jgi:hypothetical protein
MASKFEQARAVREEIDPRYHSVLDAYQLFLNATEAQRLGVSDNVPEYLRLRLQEIAMGQLEGLVMAIRESRGVDFREGSYVLGDHEESMLQTGRAFCYMFGGDMVEAKDVRVFSLRKNDGQEIWIADLNSLYGEARPNWKRDTELTERIGSRLIGEYLPPDAARPILQLGN